MDPELEQRLNEMERTILSVVGGLATRLDTVDQRLETVDQRLESVDQRLESVDRRLGSLDRRVGALETEASNTSALFGEIGRSLANIDEQLGLNNARLQRLTTMFMESKTEAMVRHGQLERRLLGLEERLSVRPANDPRGSDA